MKRKKNIWVFSLSAGGRCRKDSKDLLEEHWGAKKNWIDRPVTVYCQGYP